ncbi:MAG: amidase [Actinobacteria bacterium]|nr:amidase [Actinomycetota bacterium]MCL5446527.1 amidase [Actinomycetota bacterium]
MPYSKSGIWTGDACSLVDTFRRKELSPTEALQACLESIEQSEINAFSYLDAERALEQATNANISLPFGGVPFGVKELDHVAGWPYTEASLVFKDRVSTWSATMVERIVVAGGVLTGQTTSSEFGAVNYTSTRLHGTTRNPWNHARTPGGSSGGAAAAVAGGLLPISTGSDGGGSIRIPAGFTGLVGLKTTYGRIPRGPHCGQYPMTVTLGCLSRSVRDTARFLDVCNGYDAHDSLSLPKVGSYEEGLGTHDLAGLRAAISVDLGCAVVAPSTAAMVGKAAQVLIKEAGLRQVDIAIKLPPLGMDWAMSNLVSLMEDLGEAYPECEQDLIPELQFGMNIAYHHYDLKAAATAELNRMELSESMATIFEEADLVFSATNPDVAFAADGPVSTFVDGRDLVPEIGLEAALANNGALTIPANMEGNPAISLPVGTHEGLPVGMQVMARHHREDILLDLALLAERIMPWPLTAPA